jgi:hypothetical protein
VSEQEIEMELKWGDLGLLLAAFALMVIAHIVLLRLMGMRLVKSLFLSAVIGLIILVGLHLSTHGGLNISETASPGLILNCLIFTVMSYLYFQLLNIGEASLRLRILHELQIHSEGLTENQIVQRYDAQAIVRARLGRLVESGQVTLRKDRYYLGRKRLIYFAKVLYFLKRIYLGRRLV